MAKAITVRRLLEEFGAYYINEGQNLQRLRAAIMAKPVTLEKHAKTVRTTDTMYRMANPQFESLVQPFKATFNPIGSVDFHPNEIYLPKMKVDLSLTPDEIEDSWLGFMADLDPAARKNWKIVQYIFEEYIKKQIGKDREKLMVYKGKHNPDGTKPSDCMDGILELLKKGARSEYPINIVSGIGELDKSCIFDQIEEFDANLPEELINEKVTIFMAPDMFRAYLRAARDKGFYNVKSDQEISDAVDFTSGNHVLAPLPSMAKTKHLWATVNDNLLWIANRNIDTFKADMQAHHYDVDIMLNWREAVGFGCNQMVWATDATVGESATDTASPADGIVVRSLNPILTEAVAGDTAIEAAGRVMGDLPAGATVRFAYGKTSSLGSTASATLGEDGNYHASLTGLDRNTDYHVQLQVVAGTDAYNSATAEVKTKTAAPSLTVLAMSDIATTSAKATLTYSDPSGLVEAGGVEITEDLTSTPTNVNGTPSSGTMAVNLTSLTLNTSYYVRAYITADGAKQYTPWTVFKTAAE
ncbi:MAG: hypothetical protein IJV01_05580 [Bacteroidales bacterium]|nr:hypothetical protein [Bacteroidales bacterium]